MTIAIDQIDPLEAIGPQQRAVIIGKTGSGKTVLAKELLRRMLAKRRHVVVYDGKGEIDWPEFKVYKHLAELVTAKESKLLYQPEYEEMVNPDVVNAFFHWIYTRKNTTVYIDEVYLITKRNELPRWYGACLMQGRQLGISVISATQRPKGIPQVILSESEHWFIFRLSLLQDRKKITESIPVNERQLETLADYRFYYAHISGKSKGPCYLTWNPKSV